MSYVGSTSLAPKSIFNWNGQNYPETPPNRYMTASFRRSLSSGGLMTIKNTFNLDWVRLQGYVGSANTAWTYHFENTLNDPEHFSKWCMYDSNGTLSERWFVPYSMGLISCRYYVRTNFLNSTGNTGNLYTMWEF